jgi:hypothetical protein
VNYLVLFFHHFPNSTSRKHLTKSVFWFIQKYNQQKYNQFSFLYCVLQFNVSKANHKSILKNECIFGYTCFYVEEKVSQLFLTPRPIFSWSSVKSTEFLATLDAFLSQKIFQHFSKSLYKRTFNLPSIFPDIYLYRSFFQNFISFVDSLAYKDAHKRSLIKLSNSLTWCSTVHPFFSRYCL